MQPGQERIARGPTPPGSLRAWMPTRTIRSDPGYGSGLSTARSSTPNTAVVAPTPSASVSTANTANPGALLSARPPALRSSQPRLIIPSPLPRRTAAAART